MKRRRLVLSDAAIADILEQADWYAVRSGRRLAQRWETAVHAAISQAREHPASGAVCAFSAPELQDLRRLLVAGFPKYLLFYQFSDEEAFILRVVHGARDLEGLLLANSKRGTRRKSPKSN